MSLVHHSKDFQGGMLVAGAIYIILCINIGLFNKEEVVKYFSKSSLYLLDDTIEFNSVYSKFLMACFHIDIEEIIPFVQYSSTFFSLQMDNSLPPASKNEDAYEVNSLCI